MNGCDDESSSPSSSAAELSWSSSSVAGLECFSNQDAVEILNLEVDAVDAVDAVLFEEGATRGGRGGR